VFWVISVYFNIRNTLPKSGTFLLGHPVYIIYNIYIYIYIHTKDGNHEPEINDRINGGRAAITKLNSTLWDRDVTVM